MLLETEWVLRFGREGVIAALSAFAGLPHVTLEEPAAVAQAFDWPRRGMDFADALHLAKAQSCEAFVTFDQQFASAANALSRVQVCAL